LAGAGFFVDALVFAGVVVVFAGVVVVLFSLYLMSAVPSFLVWTGAGLVAASLLALYLMSGVPFFLEGPVEVAGLAGVVVCACAALSQTLQSNTATKDNSAFFICVMVCIN
jgi:hypothetical protein